MFSLVNLLICTSILFGIILIIMVLMQQTSSSGILSNSSSHFAPGSLDAFKNKIIFILATLFVSNILLLWVVNNKIAKPDQKSLVEETASIVDKTSKNIIAKND